MFCPVCGTENKEIIWSHTKKTGIYQAYGRWCCNKDCRTIFDLEDRGTFHQGDYQGERVIEIIYR